MTVGLVIVSHSARLAEGVVELAGQMAPLVPIVAAGGMADGGLGTDFDAVSRALADADQGAGVVLLFDLGSARMTADMAVEMHDNAVVADAPLVEGAVAAAVAAAGGADLAAVVAAATGDTVASSSAGPGSVAEIVLTNDLGLHARPAALLARSMAELNAQVTITKGDHQADATSVLALLGLATTKGDHLTITARGNQADEAIAKIQQLANENFGE
jgi:phosphoenolpyruvate---glycerone phosphotransferase subunit DhaM